MIEKRFIPAQWFRDMPTAHLLKVYSKGVAREQLQKLAAADYLFSVDIKPAPGHSFIHLISVGAQETYGPNTNADGFNKEAHEITFPHPLPGVAGKYMLKAGLKGYHSTFMKYGAVYRNHRNSIKGGTPQGQIIAETINPVMNRGELIIDVVDNDWPDTIQKLARDDGDVFFSMGCGVPFDICSVCGNQAAHRRNYCEHLRYQKMAMLKTGHQVFAFNDQPHFHDISEVPQPADKIAFGLRKVAAEGGADVFQDQTGLWIPLRLISKLGAAEEIKRADILQKLADMEKRLLAEGVSCDEAPLAVTLTQNKLPDEVIKKLQQLPTNDLLSGTSRCNCMLAPRDFVKIIVRKPEKDIPGLDGMTGVLPGIFSELAQNPSEDVISDATYTSVSGASGGEGLRNVLPTLIERLSLDGAPLQKRIMVVIIRQQPLQKVAHKQEQPSAESHYLAKEYAKYQLALIAGAQDNSVCSRCVILHNHCAQ